MRLDRIESERLVQTCGEALGDGGRVRRVASHQHDGELVTSEAHEQVGVAQRAREPLSELPEQLVARRVAERVVYLLEVVEVDEQKGEAPLEREGSPESAKKASSTLNRWRRLASPVRSSVTDWR